MKNLITFFSIFMLLSACTGENTSTSQGYELTFTELGESRRTELIETSKTVIERRVRAIEGITPSVIMDINSDGSVLFDVDVEEEESAVLLQEHLTKPYSLELMRVAEPGEKPDLLTSTQDDFVSTGFTEEDISWVKAEPDPNNEGKAMITFAFREDSKQRLKQYFADNAGVRIGLFTRQSLIAVYVIADDYQKENIVMDGIPDLELATILADDVNVGTHVRFSPLQ